jgi:hypothetical protein
LRKGFLIRLYKQSIVNPNKVQMEGSDQFQAPAALPLGKEIAVPAEKDLTRIIINQYGTYFFLVL